ncbi:MAG TPA: glycoside hydrolase family 3 N-terminal domain-containing protein, partial [Gemmatimonadales bacterium]
MIALALLLQVSAATPLPYRDRTLPVESRVQDLLSRMTPEEKFWQLYMTPGDLDDRTEDYSHGIYGLQIPPPRGETSAVAYATKVNTIQRYFVEQTRLGIPIIPFDEGLHGLARPGAVSFPQAIAIAATWDPRMMSLAAGGIARQARRRNIRQLLSPVLNLASDVRWGRTEETYGEDPCLAGVLAETFWNEMAGMGVVPTPKHLVSNVGDGGRDRYPIEFNERELRERFLPPIARLLRNAPLTSVMTAYNSVNGLPATQNPWLLTTLLRQEWKFRGVVISDAAATGGATVLQLTEPDTPTAAADAWRAGLDVVFQSTWAQHRPYREAIERGLVPMTVVDSAVAHVLRLKFALGLFEQPYDSTWPLLLQEEEAQRRNARR